MKKILFLGLGLIAFAGCSTTTQQSSIASPASVQVAITVLGGLAAPKVSASDKALVHKFAADILALSMGQIDSATITSIIPPIPASASPYVGPLIQAAVTDLNLAIVKFGQHNATVLAYAQAVGNGIFGAGF
jgi:hypothetical protein